MTSTPRISRIFIETTSACNLRCIHCAVSHSGYSSSWLSRETFEGILPALKKYKPIVHLSGHGETLLHKDFFRMLDSIVESECRVVFQSNATLLRPDVSSRLLQYAGRRRLYRITVSMDAAEKELFESIRVGADFDTFVYNLKTLDDMKRLRNLKYPLIGFETVAMLLNIHQLPQIVRLVYELGGMELIVADLDEKENVKGKGILNNIDYALPFLTEAEKVAGKLGIRYILYPALRFIHSSSPLTETGKMRGLKDCYDPWSLLYVRASGDVFPCCWFKGPVGNLEEMTLDEIWQSKAYTALRDAVGSLSPPEQCIHCQARGWQGAIISPSITRILIGLKHKAFIAISKFA